MILTSEQKMKLSLISGFIGLIIVFALVVMTLFPDECLNYEPVCSLAGVTYKNACAAQKSNAQIDHIGECSASAKYISNDYEVIFSNNGTRILFDTFQNNTQYLIKVQNSATYPVVLRIPGLLRSEVNCSVGRVTYIPIRTVSIGTFDLFANGKVIKKIFVKSTE